ncbi:hypothetical protein CEUSTIGMA_g5758.t1 [Chlamydomonas eustigma]|uniref:PBP domain-containing protein n=1 Tax=Chlamydomonas eustigma TaxID=1157962 RepID=A0A250X5J9_9CHLO|nr:hypothetical protein CEUSTIGMA_g5758.t1 [Chlamydomonas eustigma]|eukprot:GAX78316.1 hypothetical protein CEUSTIGMA_g5758.t1 [Chlamydomonas eustigma]
MFKRMFAYLSLSVFFSLMLIITQHQGLAQSEFDADAAGTSLVTEDLLQTFNLLMSRSRPATDITYRTCGTSNGLIELTSNSGLTNGPLYADFVVTSLPLPSANQTALNGQIVQVPLALAKVSIWHSLPTSTYSGNINMTACILASIYTGAITTWDNAQITAINPNLHVPTGQPIKVVGRVDMSGTQVALTNFLQSSIGCPSVWTSPLMTTRTVASWPVSGILQASSSLDVMNYMYDESSTFVPYAIAFGDYAWGARYNQDYGAGIQEVAIMFQNVYSIAANASSSVIANALTVGQYPSITGNWDPYYLQAMSVNAPGGWPMVVPIFFMSLVNLSSLGNPGGIVSAVARFMLSTEGQGIFTSDNHVALAAGTASNLLSQVTNTLLINSTAPVWSFEPLGTVLPTGGADYVFSAYRSNFLTDFVNELEARIVDLEDQLSIMSAAMSTLNNSFYSNVVTANITGQLASLQNQAIVANNDRSRLNAAVLSINQAEASAKQANNIAIAGVVIAVILAVVALIMAAIYVARTKNLDQKYSKYLPLGVKARFGEGSGDTI